MPNKKMKFPPVPGDTPRERFMNLARHVIAVPKAEVDGSDVDLERRSRHAPKPRKRKE